MGRGFWGQGSPCMLFYNNSPRVLHGWVRVNMQMKIPIFFPIQRSNSWRAVSCLCSELSVGHCDLWRWLGIHPNLGPISVTVLTPLLLAPHFIVLNCLFVCLYWALSWQPLPFHLPHLAFAVPYSPSPVCLPVFGPPFSSSMPLLLPFISLPLPLSAPCGEFFLFFFSLF